MVDQDQAKGSEPSRLEQLERIRLAAQELAEIERRSREAEISSAFRIQRTSWHEAN